VHRCIDPTPTRRHAKPHAGEHQYSLSAPLLLTRLGIHASPVALPTSCAMVQNGCPQSNLCSWTARPFAMHQHREARINAEVANGYKCYLAATDSGMRVPVRSQRPARSSEERLYIVFAWEGEKGACFSEKREHSKWERRGRGLKRCAACRSTANLIKFVRLAAARALCPAKPWLASTSLAYSALLPGGCR